MKKLLVEERVPIPEGCAVEVEKKLVTIKGKRATVTRDLSHLVLCIDLAEGCVRIRLWNAGRKERSKVTTCASVIRNAINGAMYGYAYTVKACFKHFPIIIEIEEQGKKVVVRGFLGQIKPRSYKMLGDTVARLGEEKDTVVLEGSSLEDVSQSAGNMQEDCQAKKMDSRVFLDGLYFLKKELINPK